MLTVTLILSLAAFVCTIASALNYCPLWVSVLLLCVLALLGAMPLGR
jgi:hypothetical protein